MIRIHKSPPEPSFDPSGRDTLADWWATRRADGPPCLADLDFHRPPSRWHNRILMTQDIEPSQSVFIYCGPGAGIGFDRVVVGRRLEDVVPHGAGAIVDACVASVCNETVVEIEGRCRLYDTGHVAYRAIFAPIMGALSTDRYAPRGYLLGAIEWTKIGR